MKIYTDEQKAFLFRFIPGHSCAEVAREFNARFPLRITPRKVAAFKKNHKIRSGTPTGVPKGHCFVYPAGFKDFLRANNHGKTLGEITSLCNKEFGSDFSESQIKALRHNMKLVSGLTGRFSKEHIPFNKGMKGWHAPGVEKGWFKKGNISPTQLPIGAEAETKDGYLRIKIGEPKNWKFKHRLVWEQLHGPIPAGHVITFKDGDRHNCAPENLMLITHEVNRELNRRHLRSPNPEITETAVALAKLTTRIHSRQRPCDDTKNAMGGGD